MATQMSLFVLGGILSAAFDVGLTAFLLRLNVDYLLAVSAGFAAGLGINFLYHARVTFRALVSLGAGVRFLVVVAVNYCLTLAVVWFVHNVLGQSVLFGKVLSLPFVAVNGFVLSRAWVFALRSGGWDD
jgi:putative flippase GtrA